MNISYQRVILFSLFLLLNVLSTKVSYLGALLSIVEFFTIAVLLLKGNVENSFLALTICLASSFEMASFVYLNGEGLRLYSIFNLPLVTVFPFYGICYFVFFLSHRQYSTCARVVIGDKPGIRKFKFFLPVLFISGLVTGLIALAFNDNGISSYSWAGTALVSTSLRILALMCYLSSAIYLINGKSGSVHNIEKALTELLISYVFVSTITIIFKWHGYYGSMAGMMLMPLASSLCPILLVIPVYYNVKNSRLYYILSLAFIVETIFYSSEMGSKFYIIPLLCVITFVGVTMKKGRLKSLILVFLVILLLVVNSGSIINLFTGSEYGYWKFNQLLNVFNFSSGGVSNWYNNVDASPRFRVDEFVNIFLEYVRKPWYVLFGKGNAGTILHTWGTTNWFRQNGTFSEYQMNSGIFMSMHESVNVIFLRHGLVGLIFIFSTLISVIKKAFKSPWAIGGMIWFLFYWGIYLSWWVGALMLILAISHDD